MISESSKVMVHCKAGIGRTGTYFLLLAAIERLNSAQTFVDKNVLLDILGSLRERRNQLVQTEEQFNFILNNLSAIQQYIPNSVNIYSKEYQTCPNKEISDNELLNNFLTPKKSKSTSYIPPWLCYSDEDEADREKEVYRLPVSTIDLKAPRQSCSLPPVSSGFQPLVRERTEGPTDNQWANPLQQSKHFFDQSYQPSVNPLAQSNRFPDQPRINPLAQSSRFLGRLDHQETTPDEGYSLLSQSMAFNFPDETLGEKILNIFEVCEVWKKQAPEYRDRLIENFESGEKYNISWLEGLKYFDSASESLDGRLKALFEKEEKNRN